MLNAQLYDSNGESASNAMNYGQFINCRCQFHLFYSFFEDLFDKDESAEKVEDEEVSPVENTTVENNTTTESKSAIIDPAVMPGEC